MSAEPQYPNAKEPDSVTVVAVEAADISPDTGVENRLTAIEAQLEQLRFAIEELNGRYATADDGAETNDGTDEETDDETDEETGETEEGNERPESGFFLFRKLW